MEIVDKEFCSCCVQMKKSIRICDTEVYLCEDCLRDAAHQMGLPVFPVSSFFNGFDHKAILFLLQCLSRLGKRDDKKPLDIDDIINIVYRVVITFEPPIIMWVFNDMYKIKYLPENNNLEFYVGDVLYYERAATGG